MILICNSRINAAIHESTRNLIESYLINVSNTIYDMTRIQQTHNTSPNLTSQKHFSCHFLGKAGLNELPVGNICSNPFFSFLFSPIEVSSSVPNEPDYVRDLIKDLIQWSLEIFTFQKRKPAKSFCFKLITAL